MNITAHVHFPNLVRFTGHGRVANEIIRGLHSNNNVNLRLYGNAAQYRKIKPQLETIIQNLRQPQTYHLSDRTISKLWLLPDFARFAPKFKDCDVVLSTNQTYIPTGDLPLFVIWYDAQNLEPDLYKSSFGKWRSITALKLLAKRIEQSNSYVITISHFSAARLSHFFPSLKSKIIVSYIGVSDIFFEPLDDLSNDEVGVHFKNKRPYIFIPGGLHYRKNAGLVIDVIKRAFEKMPEVAFLISGFNDKFYQQKLQQTAGNFQLLGYLPDQQIKSLLANASVCWFPSRYEGFGLPIVEAMAVGCPLVTSDCSAIPEVSAGAALLVDMTNPEAHLDAIRSIIYDQALSSALSQLGRKRAEQFRWGFITRNLIEKIRTKAGIR